MAERELYLGVIKHDLESLKKQTQDVEYFAKTCFLPRMAQEVAAHVSRRETTYNDIRAAEKKGAITFEEAGEFRREVLEQIDKAARIILETFEKCECKVK